MVFYRKYRPQTIEELDNDKIRESLFSIFSTLNYPHAFLFTGSKGLGKTSAARIIAKVINCETHTSKAAKLAKDQIEPCNKCKQCVSITNGTNMDILEIDGASNRGIDEIRDLREKIKLSPAGAKKKVYIIDEVHMLTTEAFNALLKTLEEPPAHAVFILCTTEPHKVPQTIASRCFHLSFKRATSAELLRSFERIAHLEKIKIEKEALELIAKLSDGSFRDGVKILEEIIPLGKGEKITKEVIEKKYKVTNLNQQVSEMIKSLEEKQVKEGLKLISEIVENGADLKYFGLAVIEKLHQLLLGKVGVGDEVENTSLSMEELKELIQNVNKALNETKYSVLVQLPLEIAIINWSGNFSDNSKVNVQLTEEVVEKPEIKKTSQPVYHEDIKKPIEEEQPQKIHQQAKLLGKNEAFWAEVIEKMKAHNHTIAGVLRGATLQEMTPGKMTIETGFKFHKEKLTETKTLRLLEDVCSQIAGQQITIAVVLREK
jgi:DNA polymerase-3 subunit gamma/tau